MTKYYVTRRLREKTNVKTKSSDVYRVQCDRCGTVRTSTTEIKDFYSRWASRCECGARTGKAIR